MTSDPVLAAGAVVIRRGRVLLVHRPRYDDWSFPKGKAARGEHLTTCAVREVREETGLDIHLSRPLPSQAYPVGAREKRVSYWLGRVVGPDDVEDHTAGDEIDRVAWVPLAKAASRLTHPRDRATLADAVAARAEASGPTRTLVVLRHTQALSRSQWPDNDRFRPLEKSGEEHAERLTPVLAAYDVQHLVSSSSTRCIATLLPYADLTERRIETKDALSEQDADPATVEGVVRRLLTARPGVVLCSHRPVLPLIFAALRVPDPELELGEMLVVHHRHGDVLSTERHLP